MKDIIVAGGIYSKDGDGTKNHGSLDFWIVKLGSGGNMVWKNSWGSDLDIPNSVAVTPNGRCVVVGWTRSNDGDVIENHGMVDAWMVKLDKDGNVIWQKTPEGSDEDYASFMIATPDGGYIVAGDTRSNDEDVSKNHTSTGLWADAWIVKLDKDGNIVWEKTYGGSDDDGASVIIAAPSSGYIVVGWTESNDGDVSKKSWQDRRLDIKA